MDHLTDDELLDLSLAIARATLNDGLRRRLEDVLELVKVLQADAQADEAAATAADKALEEAAGLGHQTAQALVAAKTAVAEVERVLSHVHQNLDNAKATLASAAAQVREAAGQ